MDTDLMTDNPSDQGQTTNLPVAYFSQENSSNPSFDLILAEAPIKSGEIQTKEGPRRKILHYVRELIPEQLQPLPHDAR